jgi:hypothetical protein
MRSLIFIIYTLCLALFFSCKDNSTSSNVILPTRALSLSASATTATAPRTIILTGTFNAYTDTTKMHSPDMFVVGGPGRIIIPFVLTGTPLIPAKKTYVDTMGFLVAGSYSIHMVLETSTQEISSDTIAITIQ